MNTDELQFRIHSGDRAAFRELYAAYAKPVYLRALEALGEEEPARMVVKRTFSRLSETLSAASGPVALDKLLAAYERSETRTQLDLQRAMTGEFLSTDEDAASTEEAAALPVCDQAEAEAFVAELPPPQMPKPQEPAEKKPVEFPPYDRVKAHMYAEKAPEKRHKDLPPRHGKNRYDDASSSDGNALIRILITFFLLLFLWILAGILMDLRVLPRVDLGYTWFNGHLFPLFNLA